MLSAFAAISSIWINVAANREPCSTSRLSQTENWSPTT
jgi:hypothetical protein